MLWDINSQLFIFTSLWESQFRVGVCSQTSQSEEGPGTPWGFNTRVVKLESGGPQVSCRSPVRSPGVAAHMGKGGGRRKIDVIIFYFIVFFFKFKSTETGKPYPYRPAL